MNVSKLINYSTDMCWNGQGTLVEFSVKSGKRGIGTLSFIRFWPHLSFFMSASTAATYIFTASTCTTTIIGYLEPCALNAEFSKLSISYPDLIKLPYFADLNQRGDRGWKEAQREGEDRMTLRKTLVDSSECVQKRIFYELCEWSP